MLENLKKLTEDLSRFDAHQELQAIIEKNKVRIVELQREQLLEGRGVDGEYIRPYYSENPYFKSPEAALRYAKWKQEITPNPKRPLDVPNLTINYQFHDSLFPEVGSDDFFIGSTDYNGEDIMRVHTNAIGLDAEKRLVFAEEITLPQFGAALLEKTGLSL